MGLGALLSETWDSGRRAVRRFTFVVVVVLAGLSARDGNTNPAQAMVTVTIDGPETVGELILVATATDPDRSVESNPIHPPAETQLALEKGSVWTIRAEGDRCWAMEASLFVSADDETSAIEVYEAARGTGTLKLPKGDSRPDTLSVIFSPVPDWENGTEGRSETLSLVSMCQLSDELSFSCKLPTGRYDLRLKASGFLSHFFWNKTIATDGLDFGEIDLKRGAAVYGRVEIDGPPKIDVSEAFVRLTPVTDRAFTSLGLSSRKELRSHKTHPENHGFFSLVAVEPGIWTLEVSLEGFATFTSGPLQVIADTETTLRNTVVLVRPVLVQVAVEPPTNPYGQVWELHLRPIDENGNPKGVSPLREVADAEGRAVIPGVAPGRFEFEVRDEFGTVWQSFQRVVTSNDNVIHTSVPLNHVRGSVTFGSRVFSGVIVWDKLERTRGPRNIRMRVDERGEFQGPISDSGEWRVKFYRLDGQSVLLSDPILIEDSPGVQSVDIEFGGGSLSGIVMDNSRKPVQYADVIAILRNSDGTVRDTLQTRTGSDGEFRLFGIDEGQCEIRARSQVGSSDFAKVEFHHNEDEQRVELLITPDESVSGVLVGPIGPVPGAVVSGWPRGGPEINNLLRGAPQAITGIDGKFELSAPRGSPSLTLLIQAQGYGTKLVTANLPQEDPTIVTLETVGGTLTIGWDASDSATKTQMPMLSHAQAAIPLVALADWARLHGGLVGTGTAEVPMLAPGIYEVCLGAECKETTVPPFGEATVNFGN